MKKIFAWASALVAVMLLTGAIPMIGIVKAAIPVPHNLWGHPYDETSVQMPVGELITSWIDGVEYGRNDTFMAMAEVWFDVDTAGNWVTAPGDPNSPWVKEGGDLDEPIMYVWGDMTNIKTDPDGDTVLNSGVFVESELWNTTVVTLLDINLATVQPTHFPKISQIIPEPTDGDPDYVFIYTEDPFFDMSGFYLEKNDNTTNGPTFTLTGVSDSTAYFYANLITMDLWGCGDELKLVWTNTGPAFGGMDIVVDRVEWNATVGGCHFTEPDNTIMTDAVAPATGFAIHRTGAFPVFADDTNDNAVDFVSDTPWPRPVIGPPVVNWIMPVGGESWTGNTDHTISFTLSDAGAVNEQILLWVNYSLVGGAPPWNEAIMNGSTLVNPFSGWYDGVTPMDILWTTPFANESTVVLKVDAVNPAGKDSFSWSNQFEIDSRPPTVTTTNPLDAAIDVPVNQVVLITFSEDMGLTDATIDPSPGGEVLTNPTPDTLQIDHNDFIQDTDYCVFVNGTDDSMPGNALVMYVFCFHTYLVTMPYFDFTAPAGGESWTGGSDHDITWIMGDNGTNGLADTYVWLNYSCNAVVLVIDEGMGDDARWAQPYTWTVPAVDWMDCFFIGTIQDFDDNLVGSDTADIPEIDSTAPTVLGTDPVDMQIDVALDTDVVITFSEEMNNASAEGAFTMTILGDTISIVGSFSWDANNEIMTFDPTSELDSDTTYEVTIDTTACDDSDPGNCLAADYVSEFTTLLIGLPPDAAITYPGTGDVFGSGASVTITWTMSDDITAEASLSVAMEFQHINGTMISTVGPIADGATSFGWTTTSCPVADAVTSVMLWINVTDEHGMYYGNTSGTFSIDCEAPTGTVSGPAEEDEDKDVDFSITGASETIATYSWNFGDGDISTEAAPTHRYSDPGDYVVTCTITDAYGNSGPATQHSITIEEVAEVDFLSEYWWIILIIIIVVIVVIIALAKRKKPEEEEEEAPAEEEEEEYEEEEPEEEYEEEEVVEEEPEVEEEEAPAEPEPAPEVAEAAPAAAEEAAPAEEAPAGETKECPSCGTVVPGDASECFLCGATL